MSIRLNKVFDLSISNIGWTKEQDSLVYGKMQEFGFVGLEIAPTRILEGLPYDQLDEARLFAANLKSEYGFGIPSMQSIWYGRTENIFESQESREGLIEYTKKAIDFAEAIGCRNLVFGCPKNRNVIGGNIIKIYDNAIEFFKTLGDYAYEHNTAIGMEANPAIYNTNFINSTSSAIDLVKDTNSEGFKLNLDIGTIIQNNEEDIFKLLRENAKLINHVHISEPLLKPIKTRTLHENILLTLADNQYDGYVSIEMGRTEDINDLISVMKYVSELSFG